MPISLDEVRHVARLARLDLAESEILSLQTELNALVGHFGDIRQFDVEGVPPQSHAVAVSNVWATDAPARGLTRDAALQSATSTKAGLFLVPQIIEE